LKEGHNPKDVIIDFRKCERIPAQLEETTIKGGNQGPRTDLWLSYVILATSYALHRSAEKVVWAARKALEMQGFEITDGESGKWSIEVKKWGMFVDSVLDCFMFLWTSFALAGNSKGASAAKEYAVTSYKIKFGEDETFDETYGSRGQQCISHGTIWGCP